MLKGDRHAISYLVSGFIWFIIVQYFGIINTGLFRSPLANSRLLHFYSVYLGWVGLLISGSLIQFYVAFNKEIRANNLFGLTLILHNLSLLILVLGTGLGNLPIAQLGIWIYVVSSIIHYAELLAAKLKYSKDIFPLKYQLFGQTFFVITMVAIAISITSNSIFLTDRFIYSHLLGFGWITPILQGTLLRIAPMFLGKRMYSDSSKLKMHFWVLTVGVLVTELGLLLGGYDTYLTRFLTEFGAVILCVSWAIVVYFLSASVGDKTRPIKYRITLIFFLPGIFWFLLGSLLGLGFAISPNNLILRQVHIHMVFTMGLSLVMIGALHRILSFQAYTIIYHGRTSEAPPLEEFFNHRITGTSAILYIISSTGIVAGFILQYLEMVAVFGMVYLLSTFTFGGHVISILRRLKSNN